MFETGHTEVIDTVTGIGWTTHTMKERTVMFWESEGKGHKTIVRVITLWIILSGIAKCPKVIEREKRTTEEKEVGVVVE